MDHRIVYPTDSGSLVILIPVLASGLTVEQIALKDVPPGKPFLIIDQSDLPEDDEYREAWTADFSTPDGYGLGHEAWTALNNQ